MSRLAWKRFNIFNVAKYDIVVGIDFGHRQMSAHYVKLFNNSNEKFYKNEPVKAYMTKDEQSVIPTQFAKVNDEIILGEDAKGYDNIYIYFKRDPEKLNKGVKYETENIPCKKLVQEFISEVIKSIETYNADLNGKKILYIIGCPSGDVWFRNNNDVEYAKILREKNNRDIVVMHESRGSLIKLKTERRIFFERKQGILVFDFGSSTADWTFMYTDANGVVRMIDDTFMLGASKIDMKIMDIVLEKNGITRSELERYVDAQIDTITAKESAYNAYGMPKHIKNSLSYDLKNGEEISQNIKPELLEEVTGKREISYTTAKEGEFKGTWENLCHEFMSAALSKIREVLPDISIKNIMLTGGASKMYFVKNICMDVFECDEDDIIVDTEPSACVSKGLAYAGQADIKAQILVEEVTKKIKEFLIADVDGDSCKETIGKVIATNIGNNEEFFHKVFEVNLWAWGVSPVIEDLSSESTVNHLVHMTDESGNMCLGEDRTRAIISKSVEEVIEYYTDYVKKVLAEKIRLHYSTDIPDSLNIDLTNSIKDLCSVIANMKIHFMSETAIKSLLGFSTGENVKMSAPRKMDGGNFAWGNSVLEGRRGLYDNYKNNESTRKPAAISAMISSLYYAIKDQDKISELSEKLEEKIIEGINEVIDSMALYAQKS